MSNLLTVVACIRNYGVVSEDGSMISWTGSDTDTAQELLYIDSPELEKGADNDGNK
jgi:hypothetical protein